MAAGAVAGALGTAPLGATPTDGTLPVSVIAVAAGAAGAACSLPHSIHSRVATISQAKIKKIRVWFMGQAGSADARVGA